MVSTSAVDIDDEEYDKLRKYLYETFIYTKNSNCNST